MRERRAQEVEGAAEAVYTLDVVEMVETPALEECLDRYWALGTEAETVALNIADPKVEMALLKRLGVPDLQGMEARSFWAQMTRVYDGVTTRALDVAFADPAE